MAWYACMHDVLPVLTGTGEKNKLVFRRPSGACGGLGPATGFSVSVSIIAN
jgi:hypothetical protein